MLLLPRKIWLRMAAISSILYYLVLVAFTTVYFFIYTAVWLLTFPFDRNRAAVHWAGRIWSWTIFHINPCWKVKVSGRENMTKGESYVVVANHRSMIDIPLLYVLPFNFKWVSKVEVLKWPLFGVVLGMQDNILIRRGEASQARKFLAQGEEVLGRGVSVAVFPEGTRSRDGRMGRFKDGAFSLAKSAGARILPVATDGTGTVAKGWMLRMPHTFTVRIMPPVSMEGRDVKEAAGQVREAMIEEIEDIKSKK